MASTVYSTEMTTLNAKVAGSGASLEPYQLGGRVRIAKFTYTSASTTASGVTVGLTRIPKGATIIGGAFYASASTNANSTNAQIAFGYEDADGGTTYSGTGDLAAAAVYTTANTTTRFNYPNQTPLTEDINVTMTVSVGALPAMTVAGHILYVDKMG